MWRQAALRGYRFGPRFQSNPVVSKSDDGRKDSEEGEHFSDCRFGDFGKMRPVDIFGLGGTVVLALQLLGGAGYSPWNTKAIAPGFVRSSVLASPHSAPTLGEHQQSSSSALEWNKGSALLAALGVSARGARISSNRKDERAIAGDCPHAGSQFGSTASTPILPAPMRDEMLGRPRFTLDEPEVNREREDAIVKGDLSISVAKLENAMGIDLKNRKMYQEAVEHFRRAGELGYPAAVYNQAQCYHRGFGVKKDAEKARRLWKQAAEKGHPMANYQLAVWHQNRGESGAALEYMRRAADGHVPEAVEYLKSSD